MSAKWLIRLKLSFIPDNFFTGFNSQQVLNWAEIGLYTSQGITKAKLTTCTQTFKRCGVF